MTYQETMAQLQAEAESIRKSGEEFKREMAELDTLGDDAWKYVDPEAGGLRCSAEPGPGAVFAVRSHHPLEYLDQLSERQKIDRIERARSKDYPR